MRCVRLRPRLSPRPTVDSHQNGLLVPHLRLGGFREDRESDVLTAHATHRGEREGGESDDKDGVVHDHGHDSR